MRRSIGVLLFGVLYGCGSSEIAAKGPVVRLSGDATSHRLLPALAAAFGRSHPDVRIDIVETETPIRGALNGEVDVVASSRPSTPAEREQAKANGYDLEKYRQIGAVNVIAVAVHPSNPIESLTYDQVISIFCTGSIDNWSFLGQDDLRIRAIAGDPASGERAVFEDFFCGPKGLHKSVEVLPPDEAERAVSKDPTVITFMSLSEMSAKVVGLRAEDGAHPALPSQQNVIRGSYPLYNDVYFYSAGEPKAASADFLAWLASPGGQDVIDEQRFVPLFLRPERMDEPRPLRETIHFDLGDAAPNQRSAARIKLLADELRDRTGEYSHIVLEGYTDNQESNPEVLSQQRAETVKAMLAPELPGMFFEIIPRGAQNPLGPNTTPFGRQQNRRVQIYLGDEEKEVPPPAIPPEE